MMEYKLSISTIGMKIFLGQNLLLVPFDYDSKKWKKNVSCCVYKRFIVACMSVLMLDV